VPGVKNPGSQGPERPFLRLSDLAEWRRKRLPFPFFLENSMSITISEYVTKRKEELEQFERHWLQNQGAPGWPKKMPEGEWFEQEAAWGSYTERSQY